jgi:hypothetical protein
MNNYQIAKINMYKKVDIFFTTAANNSVWTGFPRLVTEVANFSLLNSKLPAFIQQQQLDVTGITKAKNDAFTAMVNLVVNKAQKAYVWALDNNNANMASVFDVQKSDFINLSEATAFSRIKNIRDSLSANIAAMAIVQLVPADVTALSNAITAYQNTIGTVGAAKAHKTEGTQAIDNQLQPIDHSLELIDRLLVNTYSAAHADMVKEYNIVRHIDNLPTHSNGVHAHITDAATGDDLKGATITIGGIGPDNSSKSSTSDINGIAEIIKIKNGTYNATVSLAGYQTQTVKVVIVRGKITEMEAALKK